MSSMDLFASRWWMYTAVVFLLSLVSDGWAGKPSPLAHQVLLLPCAVVFFALLYRLLSPGDQTVGERVLRRNVDPTEWVLVISLFEIWSLFLMVLEERHFRKFGYHFRVVPCFSALVVMALVWAWVLKQRSTWATVVALLSTYAAGLFTAITCFPLNYLRSDMLPVIGWADGRLLARLNPYGTMHIGNRLYDFPYLPGMLEAYLPAAWLGVDLRWATMIYSLAAISLIIGVARREKRWDVTALGGIFLLCPFLQYRHDLYLQPHWFLLVAATVLLQQRRLFWSALVWGISCGVYQLSWVLLPFVVLYAYRRHGFLGGLKVAGAAVLGMLLVVGPFLHVALTRIESNTVGQWSRLPHALADPINLSYWLTFVVRPDQLKWLQAGVLGALFLYCVAAQRCRGLADTLRWMCVALAIFIPMNVLVDGYFYLTLALMLLLYVCVANGWWKQSEDPLALQVSSGGAEPG